jgi:hypothetical protein
VGPTFSTAQFATLDRAVRGLVRKLRRLALASAVAVAPIALLLGREDGFSELEIVFSLVLFAPAVFLFFFTRGILEIVSLPDRLRRMPGEGQERVTELARIGDDARRARVRSTPFLLWRLRRSVGSVRDVAGIALPLRMLTPGYLGLAAGSALACLVIVVAGLICLVVLAAG